jgi:hypothetical protein
LFEEAHDFTGLGVAPRALLGENDAAVHLYFKDAAGGLDEFHFRMREGIANLGRQTGGPRFVVSDDAVLDRDLHVVNDSRA